MIGYVTLGTNDIARATIFYDALLAEMGAKRFETGERFVYWGRRRGLGMLAVCKPHDGKPASGGNGGMASYHRPFTGYVARSSAGPAVSTSASSPPPSTRATGGPRGLGGTPCGGFGNRKLSAFAKKTQKTPLRELKRAEARLRDWRDRGTDRRPTRPR